MKGEKRVLLVYSSRGTGNTRKVAEAIISAFGDCCEIATAETAPPPDAYDFVILGFGVYNGWPDSPMKDYMKGCKDKNIGIFLTLGAYPDSEHAFICMGRAEGLMDSCRVKAKFICHGRLDPEMVARMKARPAGAPHSWDPERAKRVAAAEPHPDAKDLEKASETFLNAWVKLLAEKNSKAGAAQD